MAVLDLNLGSGRLPFLHLGCGDIDTLRLAATAHGEVDIERGETKTLVALGDDIEGGRVIEDVVVERKLAAVSQNLDQFLRSLHRLPAQLTWGRNRRPWT